MAEPVREQVQNLNLSAQDSGTAETNGDTEIDQFENIMADAETQHLQDDPNSKLSSNGDTKIDPSKGNVHEEMYMEDSGDEDDDFEFSKSENSEQRVPMSFGEESAYNEQTNNIVDPGAQQFDGFQPFFPQGYQEEITPPKNQESVALIDDGSASEGQGQLSDISQPVVSNRDILMEFDKHNEPMDSQPANMQDMNPFLDSQNSQIYSNNPFMDDLGNSAGYENQQVVPEASINESGGAGLSQTPDLLLIGESCEQMSHDTQVSNQSLSNTNGFDKAQNVIDSIAQEGDTNVPISEISPSVPEIAICDAQSESLVSKLDQEQESNDQEQKSHVQEYESHDKEYESHGQEYESYDQEYKSHDQAFPDEKYESKDGEYESQEKEYDLHDQEIESHDESRDQEIQSQDQMPAEMVENVENLQNLEQQERKLFDSSENQFSEQIDSPEEDMNERCMGLTEPTQIVPEEEVSQGSLQEMVGSDSDMDQECHSPDDYQQYPKHPDVLPSMEGSISMEGSQGFETDQIVNDIGKGTADGSSSGQSSESQPELNVRESGMSGSLILESGQTFDSQHDEYQDEASKSLTQGSSDEGEAEDLDEIQNQMTRSAMEDSIILDEGETFDDQIKNKSAEMGFEQQMEGQVQPEISPSALEGTPDGEIANEMSQSLMEGSIVLGEGETFDDIQVSDEREKITDPYKMDERNIENDYIPQNNTHQEIPDIHYQSYDSQSGEIIETSREVIDTQGDDYIDDISSEESQDHLETSQRLAEEVSEHKDFTHRHPSELEVQKEADQGYFEQREELDTPGDIDEDELYEQEHAGISEQEHFGDTEAFDKPADLVEPVQAEMPQAMDQVMESTLEDLGYDEQQFKQVCEPSQEYPVTTVSEDKKPEQEFAIQQDGKTEPPLIPDLSFTPEPSIQVSEPQVEAPEPQVQAPEPQVQAPEPPVQAFVEESVKEVVEKESVETKTSKDEEIKSESVSEATKVKEVKETVSKGIPKKSQTTVKSAEKKKDEKTKSQKTESVTKKEVSSKVTQKTTRKPKSAPPKEDAGKIPSPTKGSTPRPASTLTSRSPTKSAEPSKSKSATPGTGVSTEKPASKSLSTPRRPVSAEIQKKKNAIPLRKSLPSPVKNGTPDKPQVSPTKRETTPRVPFASRPRTAPQPRTKKDVSSDSGVEEDKSSRKTTTVTQKKKIGGTTVTTQKTTTTTTVKKTEVKNGLADSRKSSPGTRTGVTSKIGSMDNTRHSPGGGNVKISSKKTDYSTVGSRIGSKANLEHRPGGGEKKILTQKLEWKTGSRIGSLDNAKHSPGGGNVKILSEKVDWKTQSRIGSLDNAKHSPGGGNVKIHNEKLQWNAKSKCGSMDNAQHVPGGGDVKIQNEKLQWSAKSKCGSMDNAQHVPGGGDVKIRSDRLSWKRVSKCGSLDNSSHIPGGGNVKIETKKLEFEHVGSKIGSKDNIKHTPGGGDKKIESQKLEFREKASSKVGSKDNIGHHPTGGDKKIETQKVNFREKAKPKTDTGSSPHPGPKSPPPENGVAEPTAEQ